MRYPVGRSGDTLDPLWYDSQGFGVQTSYGYHEASDLNLKTGGDSDIGQPLYAVARGKIVYYHNASHPTSGFGRHMVLECDTIRGKRWYMYSHCQEITAELKEVNEGDVIGKLGKSGNSPLAHLHFSVFKVDPSTLSQGIDTIAKTQTQLNSWWEKFEILEGTNMTLIEKYKASSEQDLDNKIFEHVGLDWGNANNPENRSHLAEERRKSVRLEADLILLNKRIVDLEALNADLSAELVECEKNSSETKVDIKSFVVLKDGTQGELNGFTIDSNGVITGNYKIIK